MNNSPIGPYRPGIVEFLLLLIVAMVIHGIFK
jgi:hypothetical protein